ncbi:hypothetical protein PUN28_003221 [Cardiocondyla obscurior]|uniref:Uncharacterized protein n=1 Tax=Cardiocondyla obscurior TaxID=286306 RepID=A0AAW2GLT7_9HYME
MHLKTNNNATKRYFNLIITNVNVIDTPCINTINAYKYYSIDVNAYNRKYDIFSKKSCGPTNKYAFKHPNRPRNTDAKPALRGRKNSYRFFSVRENVM